MSEIFGFKILSPLSSFLRERRPSLRPVRQTCWKEMWWRLVGESLCKQQKVPLISSAETEPGMFSWSLQTTSHCSLESMDGDSVQECSFNRKGKRILSLPALCSTSGHSYWKAHGGWSGLLLHTIVKHFYLVSKNLSSQSVTSFTSHSIHDRANWSLIKGVLKVYTWL